MKLLAAVASAERSRLRAPPEAESAAKPIDKGLILKALGDKVG
jgi:hypothetical protein